MSQQQQVYLPVPTNAELNLGYKTDYFTRLLNNVDPDKLKISREDFLDWIHHNYSSVFLFGKELSLNEYKKLSK